jgi:hypothetical protein
VALGDPEVTVPRELIVLASTDTSVLSGLMEIELPVETGEPIFSWKLPPEVVAEALSVSVLASMVEEWR